MEWLVEVQHFGAYERWETYQKKEKKKREREESLSDGIY